MNFFPPESSELSGAGASLGSSFGRLVVFGGESEFRLLSLRVASQCPVQSSEFPIRSQETILAELGESPSRLGVPTDNGRGARLIVGSVGSRHCIPVRTICGTCQTTKTKPKTPPILAAGSTPECEWTRSDRSEFGSPAGLRN